MHGQMRKVFLDPNQPDNHIQKISFYSPSHGYAGFKQWIGFTTDSGRTFTRKYITYGNVNYNGYSVNLTFGFGVSGVKAFSQDTVIVYGHYGFVPAILYSTDQGNTYTLIYHTQANFQQLSPGVTDMVFPGNGSTGYAVEADRIIKTVDRGKTWFITASTPNSYFDHIEAADINNIFAISTDWSANKILRTTNGGVSWQQMTTPPGGVIYAYFLTPAKGWLAMNVSAGDTRLLYYTSNGGANWTPKNDPRNPYDLDKMVFVNDSTGYAIGDFYNTYKTTDSGKIWERLPRENSFDYPGHHNDIHFWSKNQFWSGGYHGLLELTTNGGGIPYPKAFFKIDTTGVSATNTVNLINYSKTIHQYKWYKNGTLIGTSYNASYTHNVQDGLDTIMLVASNVTGNDTLQLFQYFNVPPPPPVPTITSFNPASGHPGSVITITGTNFTGVSNVSFGGTPAASFNRVSATTITAVVAAGSSGAVSVTNTYGTGTLAGFTYNPPSVITSFTPTSGNIGQVVTITGNNFTGATSVSFGGVAATSFNVVSPTTISAVVGTGASGNVTVITPYGASNMAGFTFTSQQPIITSVSPTQAPLNATITINGSNFSAVPANNIVYFGAVQAQVIAATPNSLSVTVPAGVAYAPITVTTNQLTAYSFLPFNLSFAGTGTITSNALEPKKDYPTVAYAFDPTIVDVDGDNKPDVVTSNFGTPGGVSILRNTATTSGTISFAASQQFAVSGQARGNAFADFDGDGKQDIAVADYFSHAIAVSKNNSTPGTISFGTKTNFGTLTYPWDVAVGDIDGDGKPDMVAANESNGNIPNYPISVLRNTTIGSAISFSAKKDFTAGGTTVQVEIADIDKDGKPDIIALAPQTISVLRNISTIGNIQFEAPKLFPLGFPLKMITGDVDGDGKIDVIVASYGVAIGAVLRNISTPGNIAFEPKKEFPAYLKTTNVRLGDIDGDSRPDVLLANEQQGNISVLKNTSVVGFISLAPTVDFATNGDPHGGMMAGDLDMDGKSDIAAGCSNGTVSILRNKAGDTIAIDICAGSGANLVSNLQGASYQWQQNTGSGFANISDNANFSGTNTNTLQLSNIPVAWNGYEYRCVVNGNNSAIFKTTVKNAAPPEVIISTVDTVICPASSAVFTATSTLGGSAPSYQWQVNGVNAGTDSYKFTASSLNNNDQVRVILSSNAACLTNSVDTSNVINMTVSSQIVPVVTIAASATTICQGAAATFTATPVNGGTAPTYQWQVNGFNQTTTGPVFNATGLPNNAQIRVIMTSSASCASPTKDTSNVITLTVMPNLAPSVTITSSLLQICPGGNVTFTANATNAGTSPTYQWQVNGVNVGTNSSTFSTNSLQNADAVRVIVTIAGGNACTTTNSATSNLITIVVNNYLPHISLNAVPSTNICPGTMIYFVTNTQNAGNNPTYQWQVNGVNVGANSSTFSSSTLNNNDQVRVILISEITCNTTNIDTSNTITIVFGGAITPAVSISTPATTVCQGNNVVFTATPTNGGQTPTYNWQVNGVSVGITSSTFSTTSLANGDQVSVIMTSSSTCASPASATSNVITMSVTGVVTPSVAISTPATSVCAGNNVTFTATTLNAGPSPVYQWKVNGVNVGTNSNSFTTNNLVNGDIVSVAFTSNAGCNASPVTVNSNIITMNVGSNATPSVSIAATATTICSGESVTFTATASNGGPSPAYQWQLNGVNAGSNSRTFTTTTLANNAVVRVILTSNAACISSATANSNSITMVVNPSVTPVVALSGITTVVQGASTQLTAAVSNTGTNYILVWQDSTSYHNWQNIPGATNATLDYVPGATGDKVRCMLGNTLTCAIPSVVTSTPLMFTVVSGGRTPNGPFGVLYYPNPATSVLTLDSLKLEDKWETVEIMTMSGDNRIAPRDVRNQTRVSVYIGALPAGTYVAVLRRASGGFGYYRFIKL